MGKKWTIVPSSRKHPLTSVKCFWTLLEWHLKGRRGVYSLSSYKRLPKLIWENVCLETVYFSQHSNLHRCTGCVRPNAAKHPSWDRFDFGKRQTLNTRIFPSVSLSLFQCNRIWPNFEILAKFKKILGLFCCIYLIFGKVLSHILSYWINYIVLNGQILTK